MSDSGHFSAEDWADLVRQTGAVDRSLAMQEHLETGCQKCTNVRDTWHLVAKSAESDRRYEPPDSTIRIARALFALRQPTGGATFLGGAGALFHKGVGPVPAGVGRGLAAARKMGYAA